MYGMLVLHLITDREMTTRRQAQLGAALCSLQKTIGAFKEEDIETTASFQFETALCLNNAYSND